MNRELSVLIALRDTGDVMVPEPQLFIAVNVVSATPITRADLTNLLRSLDGKHQVIGVTGDDYTKWKYSARGLARLAEANL